MDVASSSISGSGGGINNRNHHPAKTIAAEVTARRNQDTRAYELFELPPRFTGKKIGGANNFLSDEESEAKQEEREGDAAEQMRHVGIMQVALKPHGYDTNGSKSTHPLAAPKGWKRVWARVTYNYISDLNPYPHSWRYIGWPHTPHRRDSRWLLSSGFNFLLSSLCKDCYDRGGAKATCRPVNSPGWWARQQIFCKECFPFGVKDGYVHYSPEQLSRITEGCLWLVTFRDQLRPGTDEVEKINKLETEWSAARGTPLEIPCSSLSGDPILRFEVEEEGDIQGADQRPSAPSPSPEYPDPSVSIYPRTSLTSPGTAIIPGGNDVRHITKMKKQLLKARWRRCRPVWVRDAKDLGFFRR